MISQLIKSSSDFHSFKMEQLMKLKPSLNECELLHLFHFKRLIDDEYKLSNDMCINVAWTDYVRTHEIQTYQLERMTTEYKQTNTNLYNNVCNEPNAFMSAIK